MAEQKPYIGKDGEVRELDDAFFAKAKRGRPALPEDQLKRRVNLLLAPDTIKALKERGNMSAAADKILRDAMGLPPR